MPRPAELPSRLRLHDLGLALVLCGVGPCATQSSSTTIAFGSFTPTAAPSPVPSARPSDTLTWWPTAQITQPPTATPTENPTAWPISDAPSPNPSHRPTGAPSATPTFRIGFAFDSQAPVCEAGPRRHNERLCLELTDCVWVAPLAECWNKTAPIPIAEEACEAAPSRSANRSACLTLPCCRWRLGRCSSAVGPQEPCPEAVGKPSTLVPSRAPTRVQGKYECTIGVWNACPVSCGSGVRSRTVRCSFEGTSLPPRLPPVKTHKPCQDLPPCIVTCGGLDLPPCIEYYCSISLWSTCPAGCGGGLATRTLRCRSLVITTQAIWQASIAAPDVEVEAPCDESKVEACGTGQHGAAGTVVANTDRAASSPLAAGTATDYRCVCRNPPPCSATCDTGTRSRTCECRRSDQTVDASLCDGRCASRLLLPCAGLAPCDVESQQNIDASRPDGERPQPDVDKSWSDVEGCFDEPAEVVMEATGGAIPDCELGRGWGHCSPLSSAMVLLCKASCQLCEPRPTDPPSSLFLGAPSPPGPAPSAIPTRQLDSTQLTDAPTRECAQRHASLLEKLGTAQAALVQQERAVTELTSQMEALQREAQMLRAALIARAGGPVPSSSTPTNGPSNVPSRAGGAVPSAEAELEALGARFAALQRLCDQSRPPASMTQMSAIQSSQGGHEADSDWSGRVLAFFVGLVSPAVAASALLLARFISSRAPSPFGRGKVTYAEAAHPASRTDGGGPGASRSGAAADHKGPRVIRDEELCAMKVDLYAKPDPKSAMKAITAGRLMGSLVGAGAVGAAEGEAAPRPCALSVDPSERCHNYIGHDCLGHNYIGHNYVGR